MSVFSKVGGARPSRSRFDLSYKKLFTCKIGQVVPTLCEEMVPGDTFKIGAQAVVRLTPLVAPIMESLNIYSYTVFIPYRLLWDKWEKFITSGEDGSDSSVLPTILGTTADSNYTSIKGSFADYLNLLVPGVVQHKSTSVDKPTTPIDLPLRACELFWNEYFRDENLDDALPYKAPFDSSEDQMPALELGWNITSSTPYVAWGKDYFTSALPWQQRGTAPALPITGTTRALFNSDFVGVKADHVIDPLGKYDDHHPFTLADPMQASTENQQLKSALQNNTVDLSDASTFDVADLRLAFQLQKWLERNARAGVRYTEFLQSQYGVSPRDDRLQRPEFVGGFHQPVIVNEVLQTSASASGSTPQGNMAGRGISAGGSKIGVYTAKEFGVLLQFTFLRPKASYMQGVNRQWLRKSRYDFYNPLFANLSEQAILAGELYQTGQATDYDESLVQGFTGRYNEMRFKPNMITSEFRDTYDYWHFGRIFTTRPNLNSAFIHMNSNDCIRPFAVQNEDTVLVDWANQIEAYRPMPYIAEPGLIDHH